MTEADESEKIRQILDYYVNDEGSNGQDTVSGQYTVIKPHMQINLFKVEELQTLKRTSHD